MENIKTTDLDFGSSLKRDNFLLTSPLFSKITTRINDKPSPRQPKHTLYAWSEASV
jgi:hypothetical protein